MIKKADDFRLERRCIGGGVGELALRHRFTAEELFNKGRLCAEITLEPGQSIGMHKHEVEAEIFYVLEGRLVSVAADGTEEPFEKGDMMITCNDSHSLRNDGPAAATMLAMIIH